MPVVTDSQRLAIRPFNPRRTASAIPTPNIHETPTRCLTINASWASHLLGILDLLAQTDAWKGTDNEKYVATQQIEEIILELSKACAEHPPCPSCEECDECADSQSGCGSANEESEGDDMGQVVTDVTTNADGDIVIWFGPCCSKVLSGLSIPKDGEATAGSKEPLIEKPVEVTQEDWSCRLAYACTTLMEQVATGINNHANLPGTFVNWCKDNIKLCDWSTSSLTKIYYLWIGWSLVPLPGLDSDWTDVDTTMIRSRWANVIEGKSSQLTADDFNAMKSILRSYFGASRGLGWQTTMDYITRDRFQQAIDNADLSSVQDCEEPTVTPEDEVIPVAHTWSKVFDFKLGAYGFTRDAALNQQVYRPGVGWVVEGLDGGALNVPIFGRTGYQDDPVPCNLLYYKFHVAQWPSNMTVGGGLPQTLKVGSNWTGSVGGQRGQEYVAVMLAGEAFNVATRIQWGWAEYFNGAGNENRETIIDKLVIAGNGGDFWSGIQPDGTWE